MGNAKPVHPPPPSSSPSTQLHPAHFNIHPVLSVTPAMLLEPKHRMYFGNCPKFRPKNSKLPVSTENWQTWYLGGADSNSGLKSLKFWPKINFWAISVRKSKKSPLCLKIGSHGILRMLIFIPILVFWISNPKSILGKFRSKNLELFVLPENYQKEYLEDFDCCSEISFLKCQTKIISGMLIFILILVFWNSDLNPFFGQI